ncbi:acyl carrier protein [Sphingobium subterraneum]|uniref:Acyl carrier protein n=1 Tax=Sphingobium subterraneum TaxID=627688 RepID=A0A841IV08_9SPHN|nr:phosphopantetheine-binding protein [Sphingobium subterraneum]MBB6122759.1 acyl carrier protein [Sphingobium subterraneum]
MRAHPEETSHGQPADALVRSLLRDVLGLEADRVAAFDHATALFGALPELDSMAVAELLTGIEDRCDVVIDDDDVDGETFETLGSLIAFVQAKMAAQGG